MSLYLAVPLLIAVTILQVSAVSHISIWGVFPDLPLVVVASWSLLRGWREGVVWGLVSGLALDLLSGAPMGASTLALVAVGLLAGQASRASLRGNLILPLVGLFLATLLYDLIFMLAQAVSGHPVVWLATLTRIVLPAAALNAVLAPAFYWLMRVLYARFRSETMAV